MQIVSLQTDLQKLSALENENVELRELLRTTLKTNTRSHVARLLAVSLDPNIQQMVIDQGSLQQVTAGQPVLDAHGVIGRVIDVGPMSSKVLLITDTRSAIPVLDIRSQERAVAIGLGSTGQLQLINVPNLNQIQVGDSFVTSGLDGRYPSGYPVGVVASIQDNKDSHARDIILSPTARIDQAKYVLLMVPTITNARSR